MYIYIHLYIQYIPYLYQHHFNRIAIFPPKHLIMNARPAPAPSRAPEGCDFPQLSELQGMFGVLGHRRVSVTPGETRIGSWVAGWLGGGGMLVMMCSGSLEFFSFMGPHNSYTYDISL